MSRPMPPKAHRAYMVRWCRRDEAGVIRSVHGDARGFVWPARGYVEAPDWRDDDCCGGGLHGLLGGVGTPGVDGDVAMVCAVDRREVRDLGGKVKVPRAWVVHVGTNATASAYMAGVDPAYPTARAYRSTLTGGDRSTLTGGYDSTLTGGDDSTLTGGYRSTLTGGYDSTLTGGYRSTLTGGDCSTLIWRWWDGARYRLHVAYPGEGGIVAGRAYRGVWDGGTFVVSEVTDATR